FDTEFVPVGEDQKQHIEITRDIALSFNHQHGNILTIPQAKIQDDVKTIPGLDGRKMSKSYGNTIEVFAPTKKLRKQVMRIVTDSKTPDDPKNPDACNIFNIYKHFASDMDIAQVREQYLAGGLAYGAMKQTLFELLDDTFGDARDEYHRLLENPAEIDNILTTGAEKARYIAREKLNIIRKNVLG
ncbi:MAG: tryptophan--tRNA ligase, partial [Aggregatilineales bacterium]